MIWDGIERRQDNILVMEALRGLSDRLSRLEEKTQSLVFNVKELHDAKNDLAEEFRHVINGNGNLGLKTQISNSALIISELVQDMKELKPKVEGIHVKMAAWSGAFAVVIIAAKELIQSFFK